MPNVSRHGWLSLIRLTGPFLTAPVAAEAWPAGMPAVGKDSRAKLRVAISDLLESHGRTRDELAQVIFTDLLQWDSCLVEGAALPVSLAELVEEHGVSISPDFAFFEESGSDDLGSDDLSLGNPDSNGVSTDASHLDAFGQTDQDDGKDESDDDDDTSGDADETSDGALGGDLARVADQGPWKLLGMWVPWGRNPLARASVKGWTASPVERLAALLRARRVPIGLVADGRWWALVWAPPGRATGAALFDASLWSEEPETLDAFVGLLERQRFSGVSQRDRLPSLLERSLDAQEEITVALGSQVRKAVEMLVDRLDALDREADGTLLAEVSDDDLYAAAVTVLMRILFLLFAEDRRLLPSDDDRYDAGYSVGHLVEQLERRAALVGEGPLEHRTGAWHRLLALARALHGGVAPSLSIWVLPPKGD